MINLFLKKGREMNKINFNSLAKFHSVLNLPAMDQGRLYSAGTNRSRTTADRTADGPETGGDQGVATTGRAANRGCFQMAENGRGISICQSSVRCSGIKGENCEMLKTV